MAATAICSRMFGIMEFMSIFASAEMIEPWCNGNTTDFGSVVLGSNPDGSTRPLRAPEGPFSHIPSRSTHSLPQPGTTASDGCGIRPGGFHDLLHIFAENTNP